MAALRWAMKLGGPAIPFSQIPEGEAPGINDLLPVTLPTEEVIVKLAVQAVTIPLGGVPAIV